MPALALCVLTAILSSALFGTGLPAGGTNPAAAKESRTAQSRAKETPERKKARYYYMAGSLEKGKGDNAAAYEYYKRAYAADPTYAEAANGYGMGRLQIPIDTLQSDTELLRSLGMMRSFVDQYPDDDYESQYYGFVATQLGETDEAIRVLERTALKKPSSTTTLLQLSDAYARKGDLEMAVYSIDRYEQSEGLTPQVTTRKISYLLAQQDTIGAVREARRLARSDRSNPAYVILLGNVFDIIEKPDSSLHYYLQAEKLNPESGQPKLALAEYYQQRGDSVAYDSKMYEVLLSEDLDFDMKTEMLAHYLQTLITNKQETKRGDHLFGVLSNQYPHEPRLLDLAARYSAAKGDFEDAEEQISYAIDLDPANSIYWGQLMTYQNGSENPDKALETYERAKNHITPDESLRLLYAMTAQLAKRYDKAADAYKEMIEEVQPGLQLDSLLTLGDVRRDISMSDLDLLSSLLASLGDIYHMDTQNERAYRMYENSLTFNPSNSMAANNYAYFMSLDGGNLGKALELSKKALSGDDADNPTYLDTYAWILYLSGKYEEAEEVQEKAVEEMSKQQYPSAELWDHMGDIKGKLGKWVEAVSAWQQAADIWEEDHETDEPDYGKALEKIKENKGKAEAEAAEAAKTNAVEGSDASSPENGDAPSVNTESQTEEKQTTE